MKGKRILMMVRIGEIPKEIETEWNHWYDTIHIPKRLKIPGFISVRRYKVVENERNILLRTGPPDEILLCPRRYVILYEIRSVDALTSEAYLNLIDSEGALPQDSFETITPNLPYFSRGIYEQIYPEQGNYQRPDTKFIFAIGHDVPSEQKEEEFNVWYNMEHIPGFLSQVPGFIASRRFRMLNVTFPVGISNTPSIHKYLALHDLQNEEVPGSEAFLRARDTPWTRWIKSWYSRRFRILARCIYSSD